MSSSSIKFKSLLGESPGCLSQDPLRVCKSSRPKLNKSYVSYRPTIDEPEYCRLLSGCSPGIQTLLRIFSSLNALCRTVYALHSRTCIQSSCGYPPILSLPLPSKDCRTIAFWKNVTFRSAIMTCT